MDAGEFGRRLASWRQKRRLTQQQLADELGYDLSYVTKMERGTRPPTRAFVARLSLVSGQPEDMLWNGTGGDIARLGLPQAPDRLIGRVDDVDAVVTLLEGSARCVTLVGGPGIGKTRLAMEVAGRLDSIMPDGAWWVPLLDVARAGEVGPQLRRALGLSNAGLMDPVEAVIEGMRTQTALIVLDNFEHVMGARAVVSRLVGATRLRVLVTSREALEVISEHVFPVRALGFPDPANHPSFDLVRASSAVELFTARAKMARPSFELTAANCDAVLAACARLDGIPLAIVLTAGGVKTIDAAGLAVRIGGGADLGGKGPLDMESHHATLEAAIGWSWNLLRADEQDLLSALAVFAGGFTVDAAAAVAGVGVDAACRIVESLSRKSLVEANPDAPSGPRFKLPASIRVYASARMGGPERRGALRRAHVAYFAGFAEECGRRLMGADQIRAAREFADDFENFRVAFDASVRDDAPSAVALAASLWRLFLIGDIPTGRRWLDEALAVATEASAARAVALAASGALGWVTGHADVATRRLREAAESAEQLGLDDVAALVMVNQGALAEQQQRLDDATAYFEAALAAYGRLRDRRGRAVALNGLGMVWRRRGRIAEAWPLWAEAAALFRAVGDGTNEAIALGNQAWAAEVEGRLEEAERMSLECRRLQIALGDVRGLYATTVARGRIAFLRGSLQEAAELQLDALRGFQRLGDLPWVSSTLLALGASLERNGLAEGAACLLGAAEKLWEQMAAMPREDEQALLADVLRRCRADLGDATFERALAGGKVLSVDDAVALAETTVAGGGVGAQ